MARELDLGAGTVTTGALLDSVAEEVAAATAAATADVARGAAALARVLGWDTSLLLGMRRFHGPSRTRVARALTRAGDGSSWTIAGLTLVGAGLALRSRAALHVGLRLGAAATFAALAAQALKRTLTRARPTSAIEGFTALAENPDAFSFPSGHTAAAVGVAVALQGEPACTGPLAMMLATGIGLSRVYLGAHYPLDVLVGALLGAGTGAIARVVVPP